MPRNRNPFACRALIAVAAALAGAAAPAHANVEEGIEAWSAGDYTRAVAEWRGPAAAGDADALFNLAQAYRLGRGVEADIAKARELYAQAAQKGHAEAAGNFGLLLFQQGEKASAIPLIRDAADRGDARARYVLGLAHFNGDHVSRDWVRAYALLTLARGQGLSQAENALAQMDLYIAQPQKRQAQSLAGKLEQDAARRQAAELASAAPDAGGGSEPDTPSQAQTLGAFAVRSGAEPNARSVSASRPETGTESAPGSFAAMPTTGAEQKEGDPPARGEWRVQLGAFGIPGSAERLWSKLSGNSALAGTARLLVPAGRLMQLQAVGFASFSDARAACRELERQGQPCIVAPPRS